MLLLILLTWEKENLSLQHLISSSNAFLQLSHRDLSSEIMKAIAKFLYATSPEFISFGKIKSLVCVNGIINMIKPFHQLL